MLKKVLQWGNLLFLFLFSLHLFNFPDKYIILWCTAALSVFWLKNRILCLDKIFWVLSLAIVLNGIGTYYYLSESMPVITIKYVIKMIIPTIMIYPFMKQSAWKQNDEYIEKMLLSIAIGTFVYSVLNYTVFLENGFYSEIARDWDDFWSGYAWRATHYSYWGCFAAGLSGYAIYCLSKKKWFKGFLLLSMLIIENYIQIRVDNRMVICVTLVVLFVSLCLYIYFHIHEKRKIRNILLIITAIVVIVITLFATDAFGISSSGYMQRFMTRNGGILKNDRFQMIFEAIRMLPSHWKGGANMWAGGMYHVHNYWLQVANVSGILPFVLWMIVNTSALWDVLKVIKSPNVSQKIKYMLIPMLAGIVSYLMMEPGGTELNRYIIFYVMLIALLKQIANEN